LWHGGSAMRDAYDMLFGMRKGNGIFISYRRADAGGYAGRLFDWLDRKRGRRHVFIDVTGIDVGTNFELLIDAALRRCHVVLAVIGPGWSASLEARRGSPDDWVRRELERALEIELRVVPVLVGGAKMPGASQLPESLALISSLNAIEMTDSKWTSDCELLWRAAKPASEWYLTRERVAGGMLMFSALLLCVLGVMYLDGYGYIPKSLGGSPSAAATAPPEPEAYSRMHGTSPLVVRSLLAVLREGKVPAAQLAPKLDRLVELHRLMSRIFDDKRYFEIDGPLSRAAAAARKELQESWNLGARLFKEGRFHEAQTTLSTAASQMVGGRSAADSDRATAQDAAIVYWALGEIGRLTLDSAAAVDRYRLAEQWAVSSPAEKGRGPLSFEIERSWAELLFDQADFAGAEAKYREALTLAQQSRNKQSSIEMLLGVAASLEARRLYADAVPVRAQVLEIWTRDGIELNYFTIERVHEYADTLRKAGRPAEARELLERFALAPRQN